MFCPNCVIFTRSFYRFNFFTFDKNISNARGSLFSLLGPVFSPKCTLNPVLMLHIWRTYTCPILRSGLSALVLLSAHLIPLHRFHRKTLRSFLRLSDRAPLPALYMLLGEFPIDGQLEMDVLSLFWSVWHNPDTKIAEIVNYILTVCQENSRTWSNNIRKICQKLRLRIFLLDLKFWAISRLFVKVSSYKKSVNQ